MLLSYLAAGQAEAGWKFAVLSDIHVGKQADPAQSVGPFLKNAIARLAAEKPDLVILTGDLTRGNPDDGFSAEAAGKWWGSVKKALEPLREAGIPVAPIPGNHDSYTSAHRQAYKAAWADFSPGLAGLDLKGKPPHYYSFDHGGAHFTLLSITDQDISAEQLAWLKKDLAGASGLRFVFGHVPLASAMARPNASFRKELGSALADGNAAAYVCGHEHLVWDQSDGLPVRQIISGTAMNRPYSYAIRKELYAAHCRAADGQCVMPATGRRFSANPADRLQKLSSAFYIFEMDPALEGGYSATPHTLDETGALSPFYLAQ